MMSFYTLLLVCLSQGELMGVWTHGHTGLRYSVSEGAPEPSRGRRELRLAETDRTRLNREPIGGNLAIDTLPDNMTRIVEDERRYYLWRSLGPSDPRTEQLWIDMTALERSEVRVHGILSNTHRQASRVALSFDFPFYGHYLRQITVATGGFIFTGEVTHRMLTATQYIAPLMANFDPSYSKNSTIHYHDNGTVFVVQWDKVRLKGWEQRGGFTFQAVLHKEGSITFNYRDVPVPVSEISSAQHPVKAGLSDAFMVIQNSPHMPEARRRTIYEYHRVEVDTDSITNMSAFVFTPLPTCLQHESCESCLSTNTSTSCSWCNIIQRCSDGFDRHRQEWLNYGCAEESRGLTCEDYSEQEADALVSFNPSGSETTPDPGQLLDNPVTEDDTKLLIHYNGNELHDGDSPPSQQGLSVHSGLIAGVVAAVLLLLALGLLAFYINTHPTCAPALYLIQRRSNHWPVMKFRNQGVHSSYTEVEVGGHEKEGFIEAEQC
ncbi:plexin domain-containing protein 1 isoform X2 [Polyodon spathula]|uniref:plexin domain-containing protein 1 isoform X2 n=1 Tax=Polyodon spathula TaxID=7913 RepID=UPI001B7E9B6F|nr:plexin domain-containing protein 1 isoform X2 [Polyodon spathula]